jgi:hypothetical protein
MATVGNAEQRLATVGKRYGDARQHRTAAATR